MKKFIYKCHSLTEYHRIKGAMYTQKINVRSYTTSLCVVSETPVFLRKTDGIELKLIEEKQDIVGTPYYVEFDKSDGESVTMYVCDNKKAFFRLIESAGHIRKQEYDSKFRKYIFSKKEIPFKKQTDVETKIVKQYLDEVGQKYYLFS
jgi:hypothetical protein